MRAWVMCFVGVVPREGILALVLFAITLGAIILGLFAVIGVVLPTRHTVSRKALFNSTTLEIWNILTDFPGQVSWRVDLGHVEILSRRGAHTVWREVYRGGQSIIFETVESIAPRLLVRRIINNRMLSGDWTCEIDAYGEVTSLMITETSEIYNPVLRLISRFIAGGGSSVDNYLRALGQKLNTDVTIINA